MAFTFHHKGLAAMRPDYNRIAGQSVERLAALSDSIFAVAMTLLVLGLHAPAVAATWSVGRGTRLVGSGEARMPSGAARGCSHMAL
jgi:Endosomal/lysosomal potassium channel TMEM175